MVRRLGRSISEMTRLEGCSQSPVTVCWAPKACRCRRAVKATLPSLNQVKGYCGTSRKKNILIMITRGMCVTTHSALHSPAYEAAELQTCQSAHGIRCLALKAPTMGMWASALDLRSMEEGCLIQWFPFCFTSCKLLNGYLLDMLRTVYVQEPVFQFQ